MPHDPSPEPGYKDKLRSLGFSRHKGTSRRIDVQRDDTGAPAGHHTEHWDGRIDATVLNPTVTITTQTITEEHQP